MTILSYPLACDIFLFHVLLSSKFMFKVIPFPICAPFVSQSTQFAIQYINSSNMANPDSGATSNPKSKQYAVG
jgi:hypothetical protein